MKFVIQRVTSASVTVEKEIVSQIGEGYLVLIGVTESDTREIADKMVKKMIHLRIFRDEDGKTNRSLSDVGGELLLVSQFTLYADCRKGNRPSFLRSGDPDHARELYDYVVSECKKQVPIVQTGRFATEMRVALVNDGPFTIVLDSAELFP